MKTTKHDAQPLSLQMARSIMSRQQGVLASTNDSSALLQAGFTQKAFNAVILQYPETKSQLNAYITKSIDSVVPVVSNATRDVKFPLDRLSNGNQLLHINTEPGKADYQQALQALRKSVDLQPRNAQHGLWYYVYPYWSYLDGMYSFAPFITAYAKTCDNPASEIDDMVLQMDLLWQHCHDNKTGLLVHGYDASHTAVWVTNNVTGASPHVWGRSLGWYCMALIDTFELLPATAHTARAYMAGRFRELMGAVGSAVDGKTGAWWQVMDQPGREGNYIESSAGSMFVYAMLKGLRLGVLSPQALLTPTGSSSETSQRGFRDTATRAYEYIAKTFVVDNGTTLGWNGTYYVTRPLSYNNVLGSAAFVLASLEYERLT
ncbi:cell wall glycosyl hydrolase [Pyrenophora seminiperda CCB06]|uniref:Cell wall glycosyl hydrolase n=1 Tax=Pyrenophora seminiperda CCB06 TaxID=1302712 RepID=A0A3M7M235_9PLEO|nr:cell wall glycosyl hydrolase [Pyrenophora seminiperda CCB06]